MHVSVWSFQSVTSGLVVAVKTFDGRDRFIGYRETRDPNSRAENQGGHYNDETSKSVAGGNECYAASYMAAEKKPWYYHHADKKKRCRGA